MLRPVAGCSAGVWRLLLAEVRGGRARFSRSLEKLRFPRLFLQAASPVREPGSPVPWTASNRPGRHLRLPQPRMPVVDGRPYVELNVTGLTLSPRPRWRVHGGRRSVPVGGKESMGSPGGPNGERNAGAIVCCGRAGWFTLHIRFRTLTVAAVHPHWCCRSRIQARSCQCLQNMQDLIITDRKYARMTETLALFLCRMRLVTCSCFN